MNKILIALLCASTVTTAQSWEELSANPDMKNPLNKGVTFLRQYFKHTEEALVGKRGAGQNRDKWLAKFIKDWLKPSKKNMGVDFQRRPDLLVEILDRGRDRVDYLNRNKKPKSGKMERVEFVLEGQGRNMEYVVRVPARYDPAKRKYPLIITMHRRVFDTRHPAFGGDVDLFKQRGRQPIVEYWRGNKAFNEAIFVAPTGLPTGYTFTDRVGEDTRAIWHCLGQSLSRYRVDWNRVFVEVEGSAMRVAIQQPYVPSGFLVRDGSLPADLTFMLSNLNGVPLCYIANKEKGDVEGQAMVKALRKAYEASGTPENLVILPGKKGPHGGVVAEDPGKVADFVTKTRRTRIKTFHWRFVDGSTKAPLPFEILTANTDFAEGETKEKHAGSLKLSFAQKEEGGKPYTEVNVQITEAEELVLYVHDGILPMDQPVRVLVNGEKPSHLEVGRRVVKTDEFTVKRDLNYFLAGTLQRRYFMIPFMGEIYMKFPHKAQFVPEKKEGEEGEGDAKEKEAGAGDGAEEKAD